MTRLERTAIWVCLLFVVAWLALLTRHAVNTGIPVNRPTHQLDPRLTDAEAAVVRAIGVRMVEGRQK